MTNTLSYDDIMYISGVDFPLFSCNPYLARSRIVFVTGVFDLFHYGHVNFLKRARQFGDTLWCGVHTDDAALKYKKRLPIMSIGERCAVLERCDLIDLIITIPTMSEFREEFYYYIEYHIQTDDNDDYNIAKKLGKFKLINHTPNISTTIIKERIISKALKGDLK